MALRSFIARGKNQTELTAEQRHKIKEACYLSGAHSSGEIDSKELKFAMSALGFEQKKEEMQKMIPDIDEPDAELDTMPTCCQPDMEPGLHRQCGPGRKLRKRLQKQKAVETGTAAERKLVRCFLAAGRLAERLDNQKLLYAAFQAWMEFESESYLAEGAWGVPDCAVMENRNDNEEEYDEDMAQLLKLHPELEQEWIKEGLQLWDNGW